MGKLSPQHQLYQCYLNLNTNDLPGEQIEIGPGTCITVYFISYQDHYALNITLVSVVQEPIMLFIIIHSQKPKLCAVDVKRF